TASEAAAEPRPEPAAASAQATTAASAPPAAPAPRDPPPASPPAAALVTEPAVLGLRGAERDARRDRDRESVAERVGAAPRLTEPLVHVVAERAARRIEALHLEEVRVGALSLTPAVHVVRAVEELVEPGEDVARVHRDRDPL